MIAVIRSGVPDHLRVRTLPASGEIKHNQVANILYADGSVATKVIPPEATAPTSRSPTSDLTSRSRHRCRGPRVHQQLGFSIRGLSRAVVGKAHRPRDAGGGSTITQRYVKNARRR